MFSFVDEWQRYVGVGIGALTRDFGEEFMYSQFSVLQYHASARLLYFLVGRDIILLEQIRFERSHTSQSCWEKMSKVWKEDCSVRDFKIQSSMMLPHLFVWATDTKVYFCEYHVLYRHSLLIFFPEFLCQTKRSWKKVNLSQTLRTLR